jgi:hypothetical protein
MAKVIKKRWRPQTSSALKDLRTYIQETELAALGNLLGPGVAIPEGIGPYKKSQIKKTGDVNTTGKDDYIPPDQDLDEDPMANFKNNNCSHREWPGINMGLAPKQKEPRKKNITPS